MFTGTNYVNSLVIDAFLLRKARACYHEDSFLRSVLEPDILIITGE